MGGVVQHIFQELRRWPFRFGSLFLFFEIMKTITLPILILAILLLLVAITIHFIVGRRCKALKECLLESCKDLFNSYAELRDISAEMKELGDPEISGISDNLMEISERERKITASMKKTIREAL